MRERGVARSLCRDRSALQSDHIADGPPHETASTRRRCAWSSPAEAAGGRARDARGGRRRRRGGPRTSASGRRPRCAHAHAERHAGVVFCRTRLKVDIGEESAVTYARVCVCVCVVPPRRSAGWDRRPALLGGGGARRGAAAAGAANRALAARSPRRRVCSPCPALPRTPNETRAQSHTRLASSSPFPYRFFICAHSLLPPFLWRARKA